MSIGIGATLGAYETTDGRFLINSRIDEATIFDHARAELEVTRHALAGSGLLSSRLLRLSSEPPDRSRCGSV